MASSSGSRNKPSHDTKAPDKAGAWTGDPPIAAPPRASSCGCYWRQLRASRARPERISDQIVDLTGCQHQLGHRQITAGFHRGQEIAGARDRLGIVTGPLLDA